MPETRKFPSFDAYQAVLQHPENCFYQEELKSGSLEIDLWGFPRVRSGGFALTYKIENHKNNYAVRCFHKNVHDRYIRYQAISAAIMRLKNPNLVQIRYTGKGIKVGKNWFPITLMPWVEGDTLERFVYKHLGFPKVINDLATKFLQCVSQMQMNQMAHGDLSHQNILVQNNELVLVDYDGMFVPSLQGRKSCEIGHSNFQHPGRNMDHFNIDLDRFSSIVIYLALKALAIHPDLWNKYEQSGDGLLFRKKDFVHPYESELLQELETYHSLRKYIYVFRKICLSQYENIPTLQDFQSLQVKDLPRDEVYSHKPYSMDREISLDGSRRFPLINQIGKIVTVVGQVQDIYYGKTKDNQPHIFINFGNWKARCFTVVLWGEGYQHLDQLLDSGKIIKDQWLSVSGLLTAYHQRPQIAIDTPYGLEYLKNAEEAYYRLGLKIPPNEQKNEEIIKVYQKIKESVPQTINIHSLELEKEGKTVPGVDLAKVNKYNRMVQNKINELYSSSLDKLDK